ncbi:MAG: nuclease-related domain-containing protein [Pseudomonadota bacterium]
MQHFLTTVQHVLGLTQPWQVLAVLAAIVIAFAMILWLLFGRRRKSTLQQTLASISYDRMTNVVLPKADDGEIVVEHILLTEQGIFVVEARDVSGVVFGGDRMHDWTVMTNGRRYTIANPQAGLFDRVAAVKQIVSDVPVDGRIVFSAQADFSKGVPAHVCTEQDLLGEFARVTGRSTSQTRHAFDAQWQRLRDAAFDWEDRATRTTTPAG